MTRGGLRAAAVAIVLAITLTVAGCAADPEEPAATPDAGTSTTSPAPATSAEPAPTSTSETPSEASEELTGGEQNPTAAAPTWDAASEQAAADRAVAFMRAFARPDLSAEEWFESIRGFMSDAGAEMFAYVDPRNVPATSVTGETQVLENVSPRLAEVMVTTDVGDYLVTLSRPTQDAAWLVEYADPPD